MMGGLPAVSVIIPTYNRAARVSAAVKSVMAQTPSELEIIIVDDGSTDGTEQVIRPFVEDSGGRISYFRQDNRGVSAARNKGIALARGDWIAFLDSDDVWIPEKLEWQFRAIRQSGGRCGACYANARLVYGADNKPTVFDLSGVLHRDVIGMLNDATRLIVTPRRTMPIWLPTLVMRAELVRCAGGFDPQLRLGEDVDFIFRLAIDSCIINVLYSGWEVSHAPSRKSSGTRATAFASCRIVGSRSSPRGSSADGRRRSAQRAAMESGLPKERAPGDRGAARVRASTQIVPVPDPSLGAARCCAERRRPDSPPTCGPARASRS